MKKIFVFVLFAALSLSICACGAKVAGITENTDDIIFFDATILELHEGGGVLSLALPGDPIRSSSNLISFSAAALPDIGAKIGDTVRVYYSGTIMESYPAQIIAIAWELLESAREIISIGDMRLTLPEGWSWHMIPADYIAYIEVWYEAEPLLHFEFLQISSPPGICATGVTFTDITLGGISTTACSELLEDGRYRFFIPLQVDDSYYQIRACVPHDLWFIYEAEISSILNSVYFE